MNITITAIADIIFVKMSNLEPQRTAEIQEEALSKKRKQRKSGKCGRKFKKKVA